MKSSDIFSILALIVAIISILVSGLAYYDTHTNIEQESPKIHYSIYQYKGMTVERLYSYRLDIFNSGRTPCFNAKLIADYRYFGFMTLPKFSENIENINYSWLDHINKLVGFSYDDEYLTKYYLLYYILPKDIITVYFDIKMDDVNKDETLNLILDCDNIEPHNISLSKYTYNTSLSSV